MIDLSAETRMRGALQLVSATRQARHDDGDHLADAAAASVAEIAADGIGMGLVTMARLVEAAITVGAGTADVHPDSLWRETVTRVQLAIARSRDDE